MDKVSREARNKVILEMREKGATYAEIGAAFGLSTMAVCYICNRRSRTRHRAAARATRDRLYGYDLVWTEKQRAYVREYQRRKAAERRAAQCVN